MRCLVLLLCFVTYFSCFIEANIQKVNYSYLGNFKGLISVPNIPGKRPVIIYSYDEFYDWAGKKLSYTAGYNLHDFAQEFTRWGYIVFIPLERFRKVNAIRGGVDYLIEHHNVDKNNIHLIGVSEGATMSLVALQKLKDKINTVTVIAPIIINDKGYLSLNRFKYFFKKETNPILFLEAKDVGWRINAQRDVLSEIYRYFSPIYLHSYNVKKRYFWNHKFSYMNKIRQFLEDHKK
ncbi:hypothetical protein DID76_00340 [Candidatus Marinamargulisbacteria bacterium SCGC AG-414-C22]|nr:hypothetical protein DID76_00340 [Candidatus Marinamargulisbacteria bacterium SCGC AG-414-C22]